MDSEFNTFEINNNPINSLDTNNQTLSDELNVNELNKNCFDNEFAKSKRVAQTVSTAGLLLTISFTAIAGGSVLTNLFVSSDPKINNFDNSIIVDKNIFKYNFDISVSKNVLIMQITNNEELINEVKFEKSGVYTADINLDYGKTYNVDFYSSNNFDYFKLINEYSKTITIGGIDNGTK